jgi:hypothetical protein
MLGAFHFFENKKTLLDLKYPKGFFKGGEKWL